MNYKHVDPEQIKEVFQRSRSAVSDVTVRENLALSAAVTAALQETVSVQIERLLNKSKNKRVIALAEQMKEQQGKTVKEAQVLADALSQSIEGDPLPAVIAQLEEREAALEREHVCLVELRDNAERYGEDSQEKGDQVEILESALWALGEKLKELNRASKKA